MNKLLMAGGIAASALAFASSASALTLTNVGTSSTGVATTQSGTDQSSGFPTYPGLSNTCVQFPVPPQYILASQANNPSANAGQFAQEITTNGILAVGQTYQLTVTYAGATVTNAQQGSAVIVSGNSGTVQYISSTGNSVTYAVNIANSGGSTTQPNTPTVFRVSPALQVTGNGPVTLSARLVFSSGLDADPALNAATILSSRNGYNVGVTPDNTLTFIPRLGGYTRVSNARSTDTPTSDDVIGTVTTTASAGVCRDLRGTQTAASDLTNQTITVTGDFSIVQLGAFNAANNAPLATSSGGTTGTVTVPTGVASIGLFLIEPTGNIVPLPPSSYDATVTAQLTASSGFSGSTLTGSGPLQSLRREGYTVILPWVASATQSGSTGSQTLVRVSSLNQSATGNIYAELLNPTVGARSRSMVLVGTLPALGEATFDSSTFERLMGNFARSDIRLTISTPNTAGAAGQALQTTLPFSASNGASGVVVKRMIVRPSGITEFQNVGEEGAGAPVTYFNANPGNTGGAPPCNPSSTPGTMCESATQRAQ